MGRYGMRRGLVFRSMRKDQFWEGIGGEIDVHSSLGERSKTLSRGFRKRRRGSREDSGYEKTLRLFVCRF